MKKIFLFLLIFTVQVGFIGCGSAAGSSDSDEEVVSLDESPKYTIAVLIPGEVSYFNAVRTGMDQAAATLGVKLIYEEAGWNPSVQKKQAESYLDGSVDMIALCAADALSAPDIVDEVVAADVPIMAFTNAIGDNESHYYDGLVCYVGQNEVKTGEMLADIALKLLDGSEGYCIEIQGVNGTFPQIYRQKGFHKGIENRDIAIVAGNTSNWKEEEAYQYIYQQILSGQKFNLVVCQDDNSAIGAGRALMDSDLKESVFVVGMGGSIEGLKAISDGIIDGTAFLSAINEGRIAIETAVSFLDGHDLEKIIDIPQQMVTRENLDSFQGEW